MNDQTLRNIAWPFTAEVRAVMGFSLGMVLMLIFVRVAIINEYDYGNMRQGTQQVLSGENPWVPYEDWSEFYNPPFSVLFLWPLLFLGPPAMQVIGGALLFALIFYQKSWVALAWFMTNSFLWVVGMGGVDMYLIGGGLLLLFAGDRRYDTKLGVLLRTLGFGLLMVKPQGSIYIVGLYFLLRFDWKALLLSIVIYGFPFIHLYQGWIVALWRYPPITTGTVSHSVWAAFGPEVAVILAVLVAGARPWQYWQLGGALAGILTPYGMSGIPFFLTLTSISSLKTVPVVIIFSGCLAGLTWLVTPPSGVTDYIAYARPFLVIYNLGIFGFALAVACLSKPNYGQSRGLITLNSYSEKYLHKLRFWNWRHTHHPDK